MKHRETGQPPDGGLDDPKLKEDRNDEIEGRKGERSDHYATDPLTGASEGNDPSHVAGKTITRRVPTKP